MSDTNLQIVRRLLEEVWTQGNLSLLPELIANDAVSHPMPQLGPLHGPAEYRHFLAVLKGAFHHMQFSIEDQFSCGGKVATRWVTRVADEAGDARQDDQTGEELIVNGTTITHHNDSGKIIAEWATWDTGSLLQSTAAPRVLAQLSIKL
ncbi:MAG: ester cyclase [Halioglobus sp.]|nr:ester cyclase [Halioglobus sp.]